MSCRRCCAQKTELRKPCCEILLLLGEILPQVWPFEIEGRPAIPDQFCVPARRLDRGFKRSFPERALAGIDAGRSGDAAPGANHAIDALFDPGRRLLEGRFKTLRRGY